MNKYALIEQRADSLLQRRGVSGHTAADRFIGDFKSYLIFYDATGRGCAESVLSLLENDANLTDNAILYTNFRKQLTDLVSPILKANATFMELFKVLLDNNGKGVGGGELALPLIIAGYKFSNVSDGIINDKHIVEVKKNGASLKPVKRGIEGQYDGLVDDLNTKYFGGTVPGLKQKAKFDKHLKKVTDPALYKKYFEELYLGCDTKSLYEEVIKDDSYKDSTKFNTALGKFALREYKKVDGWNNIIIIDAEKNRVVNIADVNNIDTLKLSFKPKMSRAKDTQAIADGYVNISI